MQGHGIEVLSGAPGWFLTIAIPIKDVTENRIEEKNRPAAG